MRHRLFTVKFGAAGCTAARRRMARFRLQLRAEPPHGTGRIQRVQEQPQQEQRARRAAPGTSGGRVAASDDAARKRMTVEERLALFERLLPRVTWARPAKRMR